MSVPSRRRTAVAVAALAAATALSAAPAGAVAAAVPNAAVPAVGHAPAQHPLPAPLARELAARARALAPRPGAPRTAGFAPIAGTTVSTDLPTRVEVGDDGIDVAYRVSVSGSTAGYREPFGVVILATVTGDDEDGSFVGIGTDLARGQNSFSGEVVLDPRAVAVGDGAWDAGVVDQSDSASDDDMQLGSRRVAVKLRSLLAEQVSRSGDVVTVFGASKTFSQQTLDYEPRVGQPVALQRYTDRGWETIQTLRTDRQGHVSARVRIPFRAGLRLATADTATRFGAATPQAIA